MVAKLSWYLILNDLHRTEYFSSEKKLRKWAKDFGFEIKRSFTDDHCFYTVSIGYVPGNR